MICKQSVVKCLSVWNQCKFCLRLNQTIIMLLQIIKKWSLKMTILVQLFPVNDQPLNKSKLFTLRSIQMWCLFILNSSLNPCLWRCFNFIMLRHWPSKTASPAVWSSNWNVPQIKNAGFMILIFWVSLLNPRELVNHTLLFCRWAIVFTCIV